MWELVEFAKTGNLARVRECVLKDGCDVNFRCPPDGSTALYWAACSGHVSVCDWLINNGAEIDIATTKSGSSALHGAADRGHYDCVALLLRRGSEIDRQTTANGDTALHLAAYRGDLSVCRLLLDRGAGTSIANKQGRTAMEESQIKDHDDVSRLIVQHNLFRERQDCLSEKIFKLDPDVASDFSSAKDLDASKREHLFATSSCCSHVASESASDLHRPKLHSEGSHPQVPTHFPPSTTDHWRTTSSASDVFETSRATSECCESSDDLDLSMDDDEVSVELVRHLRAKISSLESYTDTLLVELTVRDATVDRLRRDNALLRQQLDSAKASTPAAPPQETSSNADLCDTCEGGAAPSELDELKRRCRELEQVVFEVSRDLRNCDRKSGVLKDGGAS